MTRRAYICKLHSERGELSERIEAMMNNNTLRLPEAEDNDMWVIFLPLHGFDTTGPFYAWKELTEAEVALRPNRTIEVVYTNTEWWQRIFLISEHLPPDAIVGMDWGKLPPVVHEAQSYLSPTTFKVVTREEPSTWFCNNHLEPFENAATSEKCEVCGRGRGAI